MTKERRTLSLSPPVDEYLGAEGRNASETVDRLVRAEMGAAGDDRAMLELREQQVESDIRELESRLQTKRKELARICDRLAEHERETERIVAEAAVELVLDVRQPDNPAVETWASKADLPPEELLQRIERHEREGMST